MGCGTDLIPAGDTSSPADIIGIRSGHPMAIKVAQIILRFSDGKPHKTLSGD
jgi:hypothetical protein